MVLLTINGKLTRLEGDPAMPLLWALRDRLGLTGPKYGCGAGLCGACTVHLDGVAVRACQTTLADVDGHAITTIEGLHDHPLQRAWLSEQVSQCGYCQPGQIMQAASLLAQDPQPDRAAIVAAMDGNLCRCGSQNRVVAAIERCVRENA